uniref:Heme oxygenase n=1 Tax=Chlamydomonas reinhardtii TaxID=3055 RepID=A0ABF7PHG2_CHLRE|eukprot:XP_001699515.1 heme oxygenase [Chlamydomonas reinhardtii]
MSDAKATAGSEPEAEPLTKRLSKASRKIHNVSNSLVNARLIALFSDKDLYAKALGCFYYVFVALEAALDEALKKGDADVSKFKDVLKGGLYRAPGFKQDVQHYLGATWQAQLGTKSQALKDYEAHLASLGRSSPALLLAHVYTQHLAMASGGQIVKRWARKIFQLPDDVGTAAFDYTGESNNTLRSAFKKQFDEWGAAQPQELQDQLLSEHLAAFGHNNAIIKAFPLPATAIIAGAIRVTPRPVLLVLVALLGWCLAFIIPWLQTKLQVGV